jgi:Asp-tRNA(Asn)/Glu-tRNA(Gln) amidotransferase A subunit family amidase
VRIDPSSLTAQEAASHIRQGLKLGRSGQGCLARIEQTDGFDQGLGVISMRSRPRAGCGDGPDPARRIRRGRLARRSRRLKDIVDTAGMPTERGTPIFKGRQPDSDAAIVERLRDAGAVIMGKTVTTELAFLNPSHTRNPHNPTARPEAHPADRPQRLQPIMCRWRSEPRPTAR